MGNKYDIKKIGTQLRKIRTERYKKDSKTYDFCKSQESLAKKLNYERRTICSWENSNSHPNIEQMIELCNYLHCDMDYLLGAQDKPVRIVNEIANYTGIKYDNIISIINNKSLQNFLNYTISSSTLNTMLSGITNEFINQYVSGDILSAYTPDLLNLIKTAYAKFHAKVSSLELTSDKFSSFLIEEIPYTMFSQSSTGSFNTYLYENLSSDRINQIMLTNGFTNNTDEYLIYNAFILDTVTCTFDIMQYMHIHELKMYHIAQYFMNIVDGYVAMQCEEQHNKFKAAFSNIKEYDELF